MIFSVLDRLDKFKAYAPIGIRIVYLLYFILAIQAQVYLPDNVAKFGESLAGMGIPAPVFFAYVASWSLLVAYIMIIIGWKVRLAAIPAIIYFMVAVFVYHVGEAGHGISKTMPATVMLVMSVFLLLNGAGKPSLDKGV